MVSILAMAVYGNCLMAEADAENLMFEIAKRNIEARDVTFIASKRPIGHGCDASKMRYNIVTMQ
jgi:hypothetical protein